MSAKDLRCRVGKAPFVSRMKKEDPNMYKFLEELHNGHCSYGMYAYQVVEKMSDEELLERWARHMIERNSE